MHHCAACGDVHVLQVLSCADELHKPGLASELHQALQVLVGGLSASWRLQQHVAAALPALPGLISSDALAEHWAAYAFGLLLSGACGHVKSAPPGAPARQRAVPARVRFS